MTAQRLTFTPSRLNVGGYGARVVWYDREVEAQRWAQAREKIKHLARRGILPWGFKVEQPATVAADGSLSVKREVWQARHYRRAVMGGAGVYTLGIRALLTRSRVRLLTVRASINHAEQFKLEDFKNQVLKQGIKKFRAVYIQKWAHHYRHKATPQPLAWASWKPSVWGSNGLTAWVVHQNGRHTCFSSLAGIWTQVTGLRTLTSREPGTAGVNSPSQYLQTFDRQSLNRIRPSSPRWRGTATHKYEVRGLLPLAMQGRGWNWSDRHAWKYPSRKGLADAFIREIKRHGGPIEWAANMVRYLEEANHSAMRQTVHKRLSALGVYYRPVLAQVLAAFRELRKVALSAAALAVFFTLTRAAYLATYKLGRTPAHRRAARIPRPLHERPRPPSAPLAPPAL